MTESTLLISILGLVIAALQALCFFIMSDIKDRLMRLEKTYFESTHWDGRKERRA